MTDSLGRSWQIGTIQLDYAMPERFGLSYIGADNAEHRPVMIHRALFGSFERFIGILIEHYARRAAALARAGAGDRAADRRPPDETRPRCSRRCAAPGCAPSSTTAAESVGRKIREAELRKIPYMLVVGEREARRGHASRCASAAWATRGELRDELSRLAAELAAVSAARSR